MESDFDVHRHKPGVDLAFLLPFKRPASISKKLETILPPGNHSVAGINISGLLYNQPVSAKQRFGLKGNYRNIMEQFLSTFLRTTNAKVILVPHVNRDGIAESDLTACRSLVNRLRETDPDQAERLTIIDPPMNPSELKWVVASMNWFCGARMPATIDALSLGIPTAGIAHNSEFKGIFESCQEHRGLIDLRNSRERDTVDALMASWYNRKRDIHENENRLHQVLSEANSQMDTISQAITFAASEQCKLDLLK
jgi:polysaccharide pyruvyl transferase WcaK-like protein